MPLFKQPLTNVNFEMLPFETERNSKLIKRIIKQDEKVFTIKTSHQTNPPDSGINTYLARNVNKYIF